uniref:Uncharacterized protein n=1 Tax=Anguilla anguilla TaxID=7936 RepID=A0A0E9QCG8_ANGAN
MKSRNVAIKFLYQIILNFTSWIS